MENKNYVVTISADLSVENKEYLMDILNKTYVLLRNIDFNEIAIGSHEVVVRDGEKYE